MTVLERVRDARERMDEPDVDPRQLEVALDDVARVNRWLGGRRALVRRLAEVLPDAGGHVLDVGTGSADLPAAVARWGERAGRAVRLTAVDLHARTLDVARARTAGTTAIRLVRGDGLGLPFRDGAFDVALLSLTLHHMDGPDQVRILRELGRVARGGQVLVSELERALPNYIGARLLAATLWRRHAITRHDGPLSVLRAFTTDELLQLARAAGLRNPRVHRHAFYRLVLRAGA